MINTDISTIILENAHTSGAYSKRPLAIVRGQGSTVWDEAGNAYLDATSGMGVALLGHGHPAVVEAIQTQAQTLITCAEIFHNARRAELYGLLAEILPGDLNRFFLCNSGAEAIEGALKVARLFTGRSGIVAAKQAFHGRTLGALSMTWKAKYRDSFADWLPDVTHISYNDLDSAREAITSETAAVVIEAIQGEGGVNPADTEYLQGLRALCDQQGALLIIDEIQTGFGRTGQWFGFQHSGIIPDMVALGKGIAGGVPMGAVAWRESLGTIPTGTHGSTFGGNPLACAAAIAAITALRDENRPHYAADMGTWFIEALYALNLQAIREIRGRGLMMGIELRGRVTPVLQSLQEQGVLALPAGMNVLRLLPPLVITQAERQRIVDAIAVALSS